MRTRIREIRERPGVAGYPKGLTQVELAELAGVAQATISSIENGKKNPSFDTLERIAKALQVDVFDLLSRDDDTDDTAEIIVRLSRLNPRNRQQVLDYIDFLQSRSPEDTK